MDPHALDTEALRRGIAAIVGTENPPHFAFDLNVPEQAAFFVELVSGVYGRDLRGAKQHFTRERLRELDWWQLIFLRGLMRARRRMLRDWPELEEVYNARERDVLGEQE